MWKTHGFQAHQTEPAGTEESEHFLTFSKRSREVHRRSVGAACLPARHQHSSSVFILSQYDEEFWEKILRYPSEKAVSYDPGCGAPLNMFSREPAEMVWTGVREEHLSVDTLPSPAQLMGRKKKGGGRVQRGDAAQREATAVTQHIRDLRRKQSTIEQMKEKWCSSTLGYTPENSCSFDVGNLTPPETLWRLDPSHTHAQLTCPSPTQLHLGTTNSQVFGGREEMMDLAPGGNPMMSFVVTGTAHREAQRNWDTPCNDTPYIATPYLDTPGPPLTEFWGFPSVI